MEAEKRTKNVTIYATETATVMPSNSQPVLGGVKSGTTRKATTQTTVSSWWAPETLTTMLATSSSATLQMQKPHMAHRANTRIAATSRLRSRPARPRHHRRRPRHHRRRPRHHRRRPRRLLPRPRCRRLRRLRLPMRPIQWGRWSKELVVTTTSTRMRSLAELDFTRVRGPTGGITVARCVQRSTPRVTPPTRSIFNFLTTTAATLQSVSRTQSVTISAAGGTRVGATRSKSTPP